MAVPPIVVAVIFIFTAYYFCVMAKWYGVTDKVLKLSIDLCAFLLAGAQLYYQ